MANPKRGKIRKICCCRCGCCCMPLLLLITGIWRRRRYSSPIPAAAAAAAAIVVVAVSVVLASFVVTELFFDSSESESSVPETPPLLSAGVAAATSSAFVVLNNKQRRQRQQQNLQRRSPSPEGANKHDNNMSSASESSSLLESWMNHDDDDDDEKFHHFSKQESKEIRLALLNWYRKNRRKLPWRGDPPPWDGSTAGFASSSASSAAATTTKTKRKQQVDGDGQQQPKKKQLKVDHFFEVTKKKKAGKTKSTTLADTEAQNEEDIIGATVASSSSSSNNTTSSEDMQQQQQDVSNATTFPVTPYGVWVSEIMLQQTRVETVIPYWLKWMTSFPTIAMLANATEEQVNSHWAGLGYYRRARLLHKAAKMIVNELDGQIPTTVDGLLKLPGIGRYTACAVASIAFGEKVCVVDGNVCRVLSRLRGIAQHIKAPTYKDKYAWILAQQLIDDCDNDDIDNENSRNGLPGEINQALMELGATYCSPTGTGIDDNDPLKDYYYSTRIGREFYYYYYHNRQQQQSSSLPRVREAGVLDGNDSNKCCPICAPDGVSEVVGNLFDAFDNGSSNDDDDSLDRATKYGHLAFPLQPPKKHKKEEVYAVGAICCRSLATNNNDGDNTMWLLTRRPGNGLLAGQWEFPSALVWTSESNSPNNSSKKASKGKKEKGKGAVTVVPNVPARSRARALDSLLEDLLAVSSSGSSTNEDDEDADASEAEATAVQFPEVLATKRVRVGDSKKPTLEHVFSHVRHSMYIEYGRCCCIVSSSSSSSSSNSNNKYNDDDTGTEYDEQNEELLSKSSVTALLEWVDCTGRQVRWMHERDMDTVGITSGVKKILKAVKQEQQKEHELTAQSSAAAATMNQSAKRRRRRK